MEEWLRKGPNKRMTPSRRVKCRQTRPSDTKRTQEFQHLEAINEPLLTGEAYESALLLGVRGKLIAVAFVRSISAMADIGERSFQERWFRKSGHQVSCFERPSHRKNRW
jgi:hypothetical protein